MRIGMVAVGCGEAALALMLSTGCAHKGSGKVESVFDDPHFKVGVATPPAVKPNHEATAQVFVDPIAPYHVNLDFPTKLTLQSPSGVEMAATSFDKAAAQQLDETKLVFAVPFTATSEGRKTFQGRLEFAVCTDDECVPAKLPVEFAVVVGK